jgi:glutamine synthetase
LVCDLDALLRASPSNEARQFLDANPDVEAIELLITDPGGVPRGKLIAREELLSLYNEGRCVAGSILGLDVTGEAVEATGLVRSVGDLGLRAVVAAEIEFYLVARDAQGTLVLEHKDCRCEHLCLSMRRANMKSRCAIATTPGAPSTMRSCSSA